MRSGGSVVHYRANSMTTLALGPLIYDRRRGRRMRRSAVILVAAATVPAFATSALAQRGGGQGQCDITLSSWIVAAPFATVPGQDRNDVGDPAPLAARSGQRVAGKVWQPVPLNAQGRLDLGAAYGGGAVLDNTAIYAFTYLRSPTDRNVDIALEGNGAIQVWLNGAPITARPPAANGRGRGGGRGGAAQTTMSLPLARGWNRLLFKLTNGAGAPGMGVRLLATSPDSYGDVIDDVSAGEAGPLATPRPAGQQAASASASGLRIGLVTVGDNITLVGRSSSLLVPLSVCAARSAQDPAHAIFQVGGSRATLDVDSTTVRRVGTVNVEWSDLVDDAVRAPLPTLAGALLPTPISDVRAASPDQAPAALRGSAPIATSVSALLDMLSRPIATSGWMQASATASTTVGTAGWAPLDTMPADSAARRSLSAIGFTAHVPAALAGLTLQLSVGEFMAKSQILVNGRAVKPDSLGTLTLCRACAEGSSIEIVVRLNGARWWDPPILRVADLGWHEIHDGATWAQYFTQDNSIPIPGDAVARQLAAAALLPNKTEYQSIMKRWLALLEPAATKIRRDTIDVVGNSHIDAAWEWRWRETQDVVDRTWSTATKLMEKYPDMHFAASAAVYYDWVEEQRPDLLKTMQDLEKEGRWDLVGGWWLEPDVEMPSGESLVRQALYGQRDFIRLFGHPARVAWIPDSFGFPFSLPQIMMKSGTDFFVTQKMRWNTTDKWPATLNQFWWEGVDGTRIFTYIPYGYDQRLAPEVMAPQERATLDSSAVPNMLVLYGVGDHGGGPTMQMLESSHDLKRIPTFPVIRDASPVDALSRMRAAMPANGFVLKDELYPEFHRGVWVSHSDMKMWNRYMEGLLQATDAAATLAPGAYPRAALTKAWEGTLFNQFHDLLPGSGITPIYVDAMVDYYRPAEALAKATLDASLRGIAAKLDTRPLRAGDTPVAVFNPSAFTRSDVVEFDPPKGATTPAMWSAFDATDHELPTVPADSLGRILVRVENVPALGETIIFLRPRSAAVQPRIDANAALVLENAFLRVEIDGVTGGVARIFDKKQNREVLNRTPGTSDMVLLYDNPKRQDAWEIDDVNGERTWLKALAGSPRPVVSHDALGTSITVRRGRDSSIITQRYVLGTDANRLDVETTVEWSQAHHMLEEVFPLAFHIDSTYAEIPYAVIARPTRPKTRVDTARFEAPMLRFVDGSSRTYGVALVNDGKSGYNAHGDTIFLSLLRAPKSPDATADMETHHFTFSIAPHAGDWRAPEVLQTARSLNEPLRATIVDPHPGTGRATTPAIQIASDGVELGSLKRAEDSDAWIVRLVETAGHKTTARLTFADGLLGSVHVTDLLERPSGALAAGSNGRTLDVPMAPWEIKTLMITPRK